MGHSSLLGTDLAAPEPAGRDTAALGPGDNSDSGSDMAGLDDELDDGDPSVPVDVALREDNQRAGMPLDTMGGAASDASGTGERRSAGADAGREAADISTDHVFTPGDGENDDDEDPDLAFVDQAEAGDVLDEEDDETRDDEELALRGAGSTGRRQPGVLSSGPQPPGKPNPAPDGPDPVAPDGEEDIPSDDDDDEERAPGRS